MAATCNFKGGIVFRTGELFTSPFTEAHEDLIALRGLKDDREPHCQNWLRVEYRPNGDWTKWTLTLDEQNAPAWWDDEMREQITAKFAELMERMTIRGMRAIVLGEQVIVARGGRVNVLGYGASAAAVHAGGQVGEVYGRVGDVYGQVGDVYGQVGDVYGRVGDVHGQVGDVHVYGQVGDVYGRVGEVYGRVGVVHAGGKIEKDFRK